MGTAMKVTTERRQDSENMKINEPKSITTLRLERREGGGEVARQNTRSDRLLRIRHVQQLYKCYGIWLFGQNGRTNFVYPNNNWRKLLITILTRISVIRLFGSKNCWKPSAELTKTHSCRATTCWTWSGNPRSAGSKFRPFCWHRRNRSQNFLI